MYRLYYLSFKIFSTIKFFLFRRLTAAGVLALAGLVVTAVLGLDTNKNTTYQLFMFLLSIFAVALIYNRYFTTRLIVRRELPKFGAAGQPLSYKVILLNTSNKDLKDCVFLENLSDPRPSFEEFRNSVKASFSGFKIWMWGTVYVYWRRLCDLNLVAEASKLQLPVLQPNTAFELCAGLMPLRRGRLSFESISIGRPDPFGLTHSFSTMKQKQSLLILPKRYAIPDINLPGTRAYQHGGVSLSNSVADSEEFQSLREYRSGDPLRQIHWKSWARIGKPVVKEYLDEFFVRHALVLDTFMKEEEYEVFEEAVSVAASFACTVQTRESLLDLMFVGTEAYCETVGRGQGQIEHLLEVLACVKPCAKNSFSTLRNLVVSRRSSMSGCVCIFLAWDDARKNFVRDLNVLGVSVLVMVILDSLQHNVSELMKDVDRPAWLHFIEAGRVEEGLAML